MAVLPERTRSVPETAGARSDNRPWTVAVDEPGHAANRFAPPAPHRIAGGGYDPRDFGAVGDGARHTAGDVLGVKGLRELRDYGAPDGTHPYSFVGEYPYGTLFNLSVAMDADPGSTGLAFSVERSLEQASQPEPHTLVLDDVAGISQGMVATGPGFQPDTQVEWVNPATYQVGLTRATMARVGARVTFKPLWLSKVAVGMQVSGPGIAAATIVQAVSDEGVTLSRPTNARMATATGNKAARPASEGTAVTFYGPFTDAQATTLQMDTLGIQAAVNAAAQAGGRVRLASLDEGAAWLLDQTIVFGVSPPDAPVTGTPDVTLEGDGYSTAPLQVVADLGPSRYALSCGDPTATASNHRGIYAGLDPTTSGSFCHGEWRDLLIVMQGAHIPGFGLRPTVLGQPVAMGGVKQGPRRNMHNVTVTGFNAGIVFQGDWTEWDYVQSVANFTGLRLDQPMTNLFGDLSLRQVFLGGNAWSGISISPQARLQSTLVSKSWFGDQPYAVYIEPGLPLPDTPSIQQTVFDDVNFEGQGCALLKDGNVRPDGSFTTPNSGRTILSSELRMPYSSHSAVFEPPDGCPWSAYLDVGNTWNLTISGLREVGFAPVQAGQALIRTHRTTDFAANRGGVSISGDLEALIDGYAGLGQEMVSGGTDGDFLATRSSLAVELSIPGIGRLREYLYDDPVSQPVTGLLLESAVTDGYQSARGSGLGAAGTTALLGSLASTYARPPRGKLVPVWVDGQAIPVRVTAAQPTGTLLRVDRTRPGTAVAAGAKAVGPVVGFVTDPNRGSTSLLFVQGSFARGGL